LSAADELALNPLADSYTDSDYPTDNFAGSDYLDVRSAPPKPLTSLILPLTMSGIHGM